MSLIPNSTTLQELTRICREIQGRLTRLETQKSSKTNATIQEQPAAASRTAAAVSRESSVAYADRAGVAGSAESVDWTSIKNTPVLNARATVVITLAAATGNVDLGKSFRIEGEVASAAGRFRLYRTAAGRDADLTRPVGTEAPPSVGLLLEDVFEAGALSVAALPAPGAPSGGTLCAWSWSGAIGSTVTLDVLILEA